MQKVMCTLSYDGTNFSGFQIQPNHRTVQGEIEDALKRMHKGERIRIQSSGRTDKGVHAKKQVIHFETPLYLRPPKWKKALNVLLPKDIKLNEVFFVPPTFHARFDAIEKEYRYFVLNRAERDIFQQNYTYFDSSTFEVEKMQRACQKFVGTHDFTSFCSARATVKGSKVRTLYAVNCEAHGDKIIFSLRGNGFLYHMVRIIVSVLLDIGKGKLELEEVDRIFAEKDRRTAGTTIPPQGLFLWDVHYDLHKEKIIDIND